MIMMMMIWFAVFVVLIWSPFSAKVCLKWNVFNACDKYVSGLHVAVLLQTVLFPIPFSTEMDLRRCLFSTMTTQFYQLIIIVIYTICVTGISIALPQRALCMVIPFSYYSSTYVCIYLMLFASKMLLKYFVWRTHFYRSCLSEQFDH